MIIWLLFIKNQNNLLYTYFKRQSKYSLYIKELFLICRLVYSAPMQMRTFASSFLCVFTFLRFFCVFFFLRLCFYASLFSEICVFVLWIMRLRSLKYNSSFSEVCVERWKFSWHPRRDKTACSIQLLFYVTTKSHGHIRYKTTIGAKKKQLVESRKYDTRIEHARDSSISEISNTKSEDGAITP